MTMLTHREEVDRTVRPSRSAGEWFFGSIGALMAVIGAWIYYAPEAGTLTFFWWDWDVSALTEAWPLGLLTVGGLVAATAFGAMTRQMVNRDGEVNFDSYAAGAMAFLGTVSFVVFGLIWIL